MIEKKELLKSIEKNVELGEIMKRVMRDIVDMQPVHEIDLEKGGEQ